MDRRRFLSAVSILGSSGFVTSEAVFASTSTGRIIGSSEAATDISPGVDPVPKVGLVAIGSAGCWILNQLTGALPRLSRSIAVDTNFLLLQRTAADARVLLDGRRDNIEPALIRTLVDDASNELSHLLKGLDQIFIVSNMVNPMEAEVASFVAEIAHRQKAIVISAESRRSGCSNAFGNQREREWVGRIAQFGIPIVSISEGERGQQSSRSAESIEEQMRVATTFERLYRSTVLTRHEHNSLVSLDRDAIREVLSQSGVSSYVVGYGSANGPDSSQFSAFRAISHPFFDVDREQSDIKILVSIEARPDRLKLREVNRVLGVIRDVRPYCVPVFGALCNPRLIDDFRVTVVAPQAPWTRRLGKAAA